MAIQRPNPVQWVGYTFGARLPDRYRDWVLHDATSRTWLWRFALRIVVEALPWLVLGFLALTLFTPIPAGFVLAAGTRHPPGRSIGGPGCVGTRSVGSRPA